MVKAERRSGSYSIRLSLTDPAAGKRRQKRVTARTKRDPDAKVAQLKAAWLAGTYVEPSKEAFGAYLAHYLETADLAASTKKAYQLVIRRLIAPRLGAIPLGKLTGRQVQELYNAVRSTSYAQQVQTVVSGALRLAVREGLLARNVAEGLASGRSERPGRPPGRPKSSRPSSPPSARTGSSRSSGFWTAAYIGVRLSELVALRWDDVSLDLGRLFVARSKSEGGRRLVTLEPTTVTLLRAHRQAQGHRRALLGADWQEHGVIFDRCDGRGRRRARYRGAMARLVRALGLPYGKPHTLRHTHATLLLRAGVPLHVVRAARPRVAGGDALVLRARGAG